MLERNLKIGDALIVKGNRVVLLTKKTKKYWYYFLDGQEGRVKEENLWNYIDAKDNYLKVHYGAPIKNRKRRRKQRVLDLHGFKHNEVDEKIRKFLNFATLPAQIITGKSTKMKGIAKAIIEEYGYLCDLTPGPAGRLLVAEGTETKKNT